MPARDRSEPVSPALADALRGLRRSRGLAQRDLLRPLHLGSHSAIVDFEAGRRIPPEAVIVAYEQFFGLPQGALRKLREQALAERAAAQERARPRSLGTPGAPDLPRQLPAAPEVFTGRTAELAQLDRLLRDRETSSPVVISAVSGMGGIGKTALALHWAHLARDNFTDGELYIDMQGYHPSGRPVTAQAALSQFLVSLGVAADRIPVTLGEQTGLYRTLMADRQMLVLLDNVRDADQVRPLLPASPRCRVLITSRSRLPGLAVREDAQRISLSTLHLREAVRLLRLTIGGEATREPGATAALAHLCGLHPLALRIAAERVVLSGGVGEAVTALSQSADRLAELAVPEDDEAAIHKVFTWSYEGLGDAERRLFRLLGLHDGADIALAPLSALAGLDEARCASQLTALVDAHLIEVRAGEAAASQPCARYGMHDLLRLFAAERLMDGEPAPARREAVFRMAAWYLGSACAARTALDVNLPALPAVEADLPVPPKVFGTEAAALDWCDGERANMTAVTLSAAAHGLHEIGWKLPTALFPFYDRRRCFDDWVTTHLAAIEAAHAAADPESEGKVRCNLGSAYRPMRRHDEAIAQYEHALELFREAGWRLGEGKALGNLSSTYHESGRMDEAVTVGLAATEVFRELGDAYGVALCLANLGNTYTTRGEYDEAMESHRRALEAFTSLGDRRGMARAQNGIGLALIKTGRAEEAVSVLLDAARTFEAIGDPHEQANSLADLAHAYWALGWADQARASAAQATELFTALREDWLVAALKQRLPGLMS